MSQKSLAEPLSVMRNVGVADQISSVGTTTSTLQHLPAPKSGSTFNVALLFAADFLALAIASMSALLIRAYAP